MNKRKLSLTLGVSAVVLGLGAAGISAANASVNPNAAPVDPNFHSSPLPIHTATGPAPFLDRDGNVYTGPVYQVQANGDVANAVISTTVVPLVQKAIQVPEGLALKSAHRAQGVQIYKCTAGTWVFDHPEADSFRYVGESPLGFHHGAGPIWTEATTDFTIRGQSVASAGATADNIPQLLLKVVDKSNPKHVGSIYGEVDYIQRLDTDGGTVGHITTACTSDNEGATEPVAYSALYAFFGPNGSNG